jgi:hypothetical protein
MSEGSYEDHVAREKTGHLLAYEEWESKLTHKERVLLGRAAVPDLEDHRAFSSRNVSLGVAVDAAERSSASYSPDVAGALDGDAELLAEAVGISLTQAEALLAYIEAKVEREAARRESQAICLIAGKFLSVTNAKLLAAGLAYASDLAVSSNMGTMQDWARQNAVSRAAVSKVAKIWQRELGLPAGSHMRAEEKCRAYSEAQKKNHWRNKKCSASLSQGLEEKL